jgi:hypothetical protein
MARFPQIGIGVPFFKGGSLANSIANDFRTRVLADGGTFEAYSCLVGDINELLSQPQIATTFNLRVLADSGTFEQINCLQTTITDLQNINIA